MAFDAHPDLFAPLRLPGGAELPNRIVKAALAEGLPAPDGLPGPRLERLYARWAAGGAGLLVTGRVLVAGEGPTPPGAPVLGPDAPIEPYRRWARAAHAEGARIWMQLDAPARGAGIRPDWERGRAARRAEGRTGARGTARGAGEPAERDPAGPVAGFAAAAVRAEEAGFDGVQLPASLGHRLHCGPGAGPAGPPAVRARALTEVVRGIRAAVSPRFGVGVKLDAPAGPGRGPDPAELGVLLSLLAALGVDLVELVLPAGSRWDAEADGARGLRERIAPAAPLPLMATGGIDCPRQAGRVLGAGAALIGMGGALAHDPDLPARWRADPTGARAGEGGGEGTDGRRCGPADAALVRAQVRRLAEGLEPGPQHHARRLLVLDLLRRGRPDPLRERRAASRRAVTPEVIAPGGVRAAP
ncbi:2,4-dienoyl-CoA reductase [Streptomyces sp. BI20]|uniref:oxidoreductase n=1 Tax=Streptomyces sp. BI20 TaxID=3403460 RepID=UPI003C77887C